MSASGFGEFTGDWDHRALPANIRLGHGCFLERRESFQRFRSRRDPGLVIGDRVRIWMWSAFSVDPGGWIEIGDDSELVGAVFMCADHISIGRGVLVSYQVTIADSDFHPLDPEARRRDAVASAPGGDPSQRPPCITRPVRIDDGARIGIGAIILKGVHIGAGAQVGAGAVVVRDVPAGASVAGNPARVVDATGPAR